MNYILSKLLYFFVLFIASHIATKIDSTNSGFTLDTKQFLLLFGMIALFCLIAIILLNIANPKREENFEEIIVHELMHIKMYPLDQVTESLIVNCFEEGSAANKFAYEQFFTTLEQTVEELAKCFLLEFGENKELSYGRCRQEMSFNDLYDGLKNID